MYVLNKLVWAVLNPLSASLLALLVGGLFARRRSSYCSWRVFAAFGFLLLYFSSTGIAVSLLGLPLEREYLPFESVESLPAADAIVVLGGGVSKVDFLRYPDLN